MKRKWKQRDLTREQYLVAFEQASSFYEGVLSQGEDELSMTHYRWGRAAAELVERYNIDTSDAFQIVSVRDGPDSVLVHRSQSVLVTADRGLAKAARAEGLRAWRVDEPLHPTAHDNSLWASEAKR